MSKSPIAPALFARGLVIWLALAAACSSTLIPPAPAAAPTPRCGDRIIALWNTRQQLPSHVRAWCAARALDTSDSPGLRGALLANQLGALPERSTPISRCARNVIDDWYVDGHIDQIYPGNCLALTIATAPSDLLTYSHLPRDIILAAAYARQGRTTPASVIKRLNELARPKQPTQPSVSA